MPRAAASFLWRNPWIGALVLVSAGTSDNMKNHITNRLYARVGARVWGGVSVNVLLSLPEALRQKASG